MTTIGEPLLFGLGFLVCGALLEEARHRLFPRRVETDHDLHSELFWGERRNSALHVPTKECRDCRSVCLTASQYLKCGGVCIRCEGERVAEAAWMRAEA